MSVIPGVGGRGRKVTESLKPRLHNELEIRLASVGRSFLKHTNKQNNNKTVKSKHKPFQIERDFCLPPSVCVERIQELCPPKTGLQRSAWDAEFLGVAILPFPWVLSRDGPLALVWLQTVTTVAPHGLLVVLLSFSTQEEHGEILKRKSSLCLDLGTAPYYKENERSGPQGSQFSATREALACSCKQ